MRNQGPSLDSLGSMQLDGNGAAAGEAAVQLPHLGRERTSLPAFSDSSAAIYMCDSAGRVTYFNEAAAQLWGKSPDPGAGPWAGCARVLRADGTEAPRFAAPTVRAGSRQHSEEFLIERADGTRRHVALYPDVLFDAAGKEAGALNIIVDITEQKKADALQSGQRQVLELMVQDAPLSEVLERLILMIEAQSTSGMIGSILLLDDDGTHLRHGAAPHLPEAYCAAIDGVAIGPSVGSCGTAAYLK